MVLRLLAAGLLLIGALNVMIDWAKTQMDKTSLRPGRCAYLALPAMLGVLVLAATFPLARRFKQTQDEDE